MHAREGRRRAEEQVARQRAGRVLKNTFTMWRSRRVSLHASEQLLCRRHNNQLVQTLFDALRRHADLTRRLLTGYEACHRLMHTKASFAVWRQRAQLSAKASALERTRNAKILHGSLCKWIEAAVCTGQGRRTRLHRFFSAWRDLTHSQRTARMVAEAHYDRRLQAQMFLSLWQEAFMDASIKSLPRLAVDCIRRRASLVLLQAKATFWRCGNLRAPRWCMYMRGCVCLCVCWRYFVFVGERGGEREKRLSCRSFLVSLNWFSDCFFIARHSNAQKATSIAHLRSRPSSLAPGTFSS